ncbi:MAG: hypothetical protein LUO93_11715 [Methanomicrobiales archaeon]|nr:hypothetical protein [Methanomicrobiales archaeon]
MREIVTDRTRRARQQRGELLEGEKNDNYQDLVAKLIPAEVVAVYIAGDGAISAASEAGLTLNYGGITSVLFVALLIGTPLYLMRISKVTDVRQLAVSTFSFVVWAFALGGPFKIFFSWWNPIYGSILILIYTFYIAIILAK